eukprot:Em0002g1838a
MQWHNINRFSRDTPTEYDIDSHKVASNNKLPLASAGKKKNDFMKTFSIAEWKKPTSVQQAGDTINNATHVRHSINYLLQHFLTNKPVRRKQPSALHLMTSHHLLQLDKQSLVSWI